MTSNDNDSPRNDEEGADLAPFFAALRADPPSGLEAAILGAVDDPEWAARIYREDLARAARRALAPLSLALVAAALLLGALLVLDPDQAPGQSASSDPLTYGVTKAPSDASTWLTGLGEDQ